MILVSVAAIHRFFLWSQDVTHAYFQDGENVRRNVFIRAPKEFQLGEGNMLKLLKSLYVLAGAGD